jgi:hypothetical protein
MNEKNKQNVGKLLLFATAAAVAVFREEAHTKNKKEKEKNVFANEI